MGRWAEDANGRLRAAAMQLYVERGFEETTVAEIAARAGVTARTFFRHFADKREVLFAGASELQTRLVAALEAAPAEATPMQAVVVALDAAAEILGQSREHSRLRQAVINSHAELLERELIKLVALSAALAAGLRRRGVPEPDASLAAEAGLVVLRVAFGRWTQPKEAQPDEAQPEDAQPEDAQPEEAQPEEAQPKGAQLEEGAELKDAGDGPAEVTLAQMMREALERLAMVTAGQGSRSTPTA